MSSSRSDGGSIRLPASPSESYFELAELDRAFTVRWARRVGSPRPLAPDPADLEMLALIASLKHVLTSQLHRHINPSRAVTTTQRRLKRLSDAGLVERFQFHRRDGGGVPMCYAITLAGLELLRANDRLIKPLDGDDGEVRGTSVDTHQGGERRLREARHDVHVAGWVLALTKLLHEARPTVRGPDESVLSPRLGSTRDGRGWLAPADLRLPGGRVPHDFLRTDPRGQRTAVESFETVRPDAILELREVACKRLDPSRHGPDRARGRNISEDVPAASQGPSGIDVIVEFDDRLPSGPAAGKLERYDHFLAGWSVQTRRYGRRLEATPLVVFVCRARDRARECARRADAVLRACRAYAGEYPFDWEYPGRERVLFASERDVHEGVLGAFGIPRLPPDIRVLAAHGDPRAGEAAVQPSEIFPRARTDGE
jgi:hypothetical protein